MRFRRWLAAAIFSGSASIAAAAGTHGFRILGHEPLRDLPRAAAGSDLSFEAYGRRFDLQLEPNERIRVRLQAAAGQLEPLRGRVRGLAGSWVRLTRTSAGLYGMIYDGHELYAIEPAREAARFAVGPLAASGSASVIYRLADTLMLPGEASCATGGPAAAESPATTAEQVFEAVSDELQSVAGALSPSRQINVAVVGDFELGRFRFPGGLSAEEAIAVRMNTVDGIFSEQVGVKVQVASVTVFRSGNDPFSNTASAEALLEELASWRASTAAQRSQGITHLLTGRNLEGNTVGIAYVGGLCSQRSGAGLSEGTLAQTASALVIAHEMGHNFGAVHDGEAGRGCDTTPQTFLMAPNLNGSREFSQCSLDHMAPRVAQASCLAQFSGADAAIVPPATAVQSLRDVPFAFGFDVHSGGTLSVENVTATVQLPTSLALQGGTASGGASCATGAGNSLTCALGTLAAGASRTITVEAIGRQVGSASAGLALTATNDAIASNNSRQVTVRIDPSADLAVTLSASPASIALDGTGQATAQVSNLGSADVEDALLSVTAPAGLSITAVGGNGLGCSLQSGAMHCAAAALAAGAASAVMFEVRGRQAGTARLSASVSASVGDPVPGNNSAEASITVNAPSRTASGGGGGGGGRSGVLLLGTLLLLGLRRIARRRHAAPGRIVQGT